ncbi:MAG TPA: hypothetical protein PLR11_02105 [Candidatus Paceibacterota bacterium]|nr:hypothetical protein [Candidatus Paceibacterota bacterium]
MKTVEFDAYIDLGRIESVKHKIYKSKSGKEYLPVIIRVCDEPDKYGNHLSIRVKTGGGEKFVFLGNGKEYNPTAKKNENDLP